MSVGTFLLAGYAPFNFLRYANSPASPLPNSSRLVGSGVGLALALVLAPKPRADGPATTFRVMFVGFTVTVKCSLALMLVPVIFDFVRSVRRVLFGNRAGLRSDRSRKESRELSSKERSAQTKTMNADRTHRERVEAETENHLASQPVFSVFLI